MNKMLTDQQIEQFHDRGYVKNLRVLDDQTVQQAQLHFEAVTADLESKQLTHNDVNGWWAVNRSYWNLCTTPAVLDCIEDILGPDLFIWGGQYFYKGPGDGTTVPWHQDTQYWPLAPREHCITAWLALWDTDSSNGCMQVIPGTHKQLLNHGGQAQQTDVLDLVVKPDEIDENDAVDIDLKAGEMSLHTDALVHGSHANDSDLMRCGMTMRVSSPDVKADMNEWSFFHWIRLRGNDPGTNNPVLDPPTEDRVPTGYNQFGSESS